MSAFLGIVFCLVVQILAYVLVSRITMLIKNLTGKQIKINYTLLGLFLIPPSIALFKLLAAFLLGELKPSDFHIHFSLDKVSFINPVDVFLNNIKLSFKYNPSVLILSTFFIFSVHLFCCFKIISIKSIKSIKKDFFGLTLLFCSLIYLLFAVTHSIVDNYNQTIEKEKQEIANAQREAVLASKSSILDGYKSGLSYGRAWNGYRYPRKSHCEAGYSQSVGEESCENTKYFCNQVANLYASDVLPDYIKALEKAKFDCVFSEWNKRY